MTAESSRVTEFDAMKDSFTALEKSLTLEIQDLSESENETIFSFMQGGRLIRTITIPIVTDGSEEEY